jgi:predicted HTH domain antitoxin
MLTLNIQLPDELLTSRDKGQLEALAREALIVRLYELGELSSGEGAELLGISRREFLDLVGRYGVSIFDDAIDVQKEARYGD